MEKDVEARMGRLSVQLAAMQFAVAALFAELLDHAPERARFAADLLAGSAAAALPPAIGAETESLAKAWRGEIAHAERND